MQMDSDVPSEADEPAKNIKRPRGRPRKDGSTRGRGGRPLGRGGQRGVKRGPRAPLEPSHEFKVLQAQAFAAFIDEQNLDKAHKLVNEAITLNPEVYAAHALLSEIFAAKGEKDKAFTALFSAAHTNPRDPSVWKKVADASLARLDEDRHRALADAVYCYARMIEINPKDYDALFQRALLNKQLGYKRKALKEFERLLNMLPHASNILYQIAEICIDLKEVQTAKSYYDETIRHYQSPEFEETSDFTWNDVNIYVELFSYMNRYAEGISMLKSLCRWLCGRKDDVIWDEVQNDDREWDLEDKPRRIKTPNFVPGKYPAESYGEGLPMELRIKLGLYRLKLGASHKREAFKHLEWLEPDSREEDAKIFDYPDLFREVADSLKAAGQFKEALRYYTPLVDSSEGQDTPLFIAAGECFQIGGDLDRAEECYRGAIAADEKNVEARVKLAKMLEDIGEADEAFRYINEAVALGRDASNRPQKRKYRRKAQGLATDSTPTSSKIRELLPKGQIRDRTTLNRTSESQRESPKSGEIPEAETDSASSIALIKNSTLSKTPGRSLYLPSKRSRWNQRLFFGNEGPRPRGRAAWRTPTAEEKATAEELDRARTKHVQQLYTTLQTLQQPAREGNQEALEDWLDTADEMLRDFRSNRVFYPYERHQKFEGYDRASRAKQFRKKNVKLKDLAAEDLNASLLEDMAERLHRKSGQPPPGLSPGATSSSSSKVPTSYRDIPFTTWLDIFLESALHLSSLGERSDCYDILTAAADCVIFYHDKPSMLHIHVCWFTSALRLSDEATLADVARWFIREYQFVSSVYRLFAALNRLHRPTNKNKRGLSKAGPNPGSSGNRGSAASQAGWYKDSPTMKYLLRQVKAMDYSVPRDIPDSDGEMPPPRPQESLYRDRASLSTRDEKGNPIPATAMDVNLIVLYGHILYAGGSFPNALGYFFRAHALDEHDPVVLLSIALAYIHASLKRQGGSRHYMIMQGLAFLEKYAEAKKLRSSGPTMSLAEKQEVEFNKARVWGMLNIGHLAAQGYRKCLEMAEAGPPDDEQQECEFHESFTLEAALALQEIYGLSGDVEMAKRVTDRWLVIE